MTDHAKNCLNCDTELIGQFCSGCGQKSDTHRISFRNFLFHDLLHGTFHIEKGMFFTAKQAMTRPGRAALDYIAGKRKRYYNVFYLILIMIGLMLFFRHLHELFDSHGNELPPDPVGMNAASQRIDEIFTSKSKYVILLFLPFAALNSLILFRRKKLNLSEHAIIAGMVLLGILMLSTVGNIYFFINGFIGLGDMTPSIILAVLINIYIGYGYFDAFASDYSKWGIAFRILLFFALFCLEMLILLYLLIGFVTDWKFGEVVVAPFG